MPTNYITASQNRLKVEIIEEFFHCFGRGIAILSEIGATTVSSSHQQEKQVNIIVLEFKLPYSIKGIDFTKYMAGQMGMILGVTTASEFMYICQKIKDSSPTLETEESAAYCP